MTGTGEGTEAGGQRRAGRGGTAAIRWRVSQMLLVLIVVATVLLALRLVSGDGAAPPTATPAPIVFPTPPRS